MGLKKNLMLKLAKAEAIYETAQKKKDKKDSEDRLEAYNNWRMGEEKKGRTQDEHGRSLVKVMMDCVRSANPREPVVESMCNVIGNVDGKHNQESIVELVSF